MVRNGIDGEILFTLTEDDLKKRPLRIECLGTFSRRFGASEGFVPTAILSRFW